MLKYTNIRVKQKGAITMKKQITLCLVGGALLLGNAARAFSPGVYYYSNEATKAEAYAGRMKVVNQATKSHYKQVKKHNRMTSKALRVALKQDRQYRRMLASEDQYIQTRQNFEYYPQDQYDYVKAQGSARLVELK